MGFGKLVVGIMAVSMATQGKMGVREETTPVISQETIQESTLTPVKESKTTIKNLLRTALQPVGKTMYIWGGGWNEADTGAGIEAVTLGVSPQWQVFAEQQNGGYSSKNTQYQIHQGLDCSGYIGWVLYNVLETENGKEGYVMFSTEMAENFAKKGLGRYIPNREIKTWQAGDIVSMKGHVWMAVGTCGDGSVVLLHSSPPGVQLAGTANPDGSKSQAVRLAERYMRQYYPIWYDKYPNCQKPHTYLKSGGKMSWNETTLSDPDGYRNQSAEQILKDLFETIEVAF